MKTEDATDTIRWLAHRDHGHGDKIFTGGRTLSLLTPEGAQARLVDADSMGDAVRSLGLAAAGAVYLETRAKLDARDPTNDADWTLPEPWMTWVQHGDGWVVLGDPKTYSRKRLYEEYPMLSALCEARDKANERVLPIGVN